MEAQLHAALLASLRLSVEKHRQLFRRNSASPGFLLKVNGAKLQSTAAANNRKRCRESTDDIIVRAKDNSPPLGEEWPSLVLNSLLSVLRQFESNERRGQKDDGEDHTAVSMIATALSSMSGLEMRHCGLQARHLCPGNHGVAGSLSVSDIILSPRRLWNSITPAVSPPTLLFMETLDLECNELGDVGMQVLCSGLIVHLRGLRRLLLASNKITSVGLLLLADAAQPRGDTSPPLHLETLGLTNNPLGTRACETTNGQPSQVAWCDAFRKLILYLSSTLRRVHLNHAGLNSEEVICVLHTLFEFVYRDRGRCVFDMVYLRENQLAGREEALRSLRSRPEEAVVVDSFLHRHVNI